MKAVFNWSLLKSFSLLLWQQAQQGGAAQAAVNGTNILTGAVTGAIGGAFGGAGIIGAGIYGGFMSYAQGGNFASGFVSAGIGGLFGRTSGR